MGENGEADKMLPKLGENGMPEIDEDTADENEAKSLKLFVGLLFAPRLIGFLIAWLIYRFGDQASADIMIAKIVAFQPQAGYLFIAISIFTLIAFWLNTYPMIFHKSRIMFGNSGNLRANQIIYKVNFQNDQTLPVVVMEDEGEIGAYNRANRSLHHFVENVAAILLQIISVGIVFPLPTMILVIVFALGRAMHQTGYAGRGYGGHGAGFGIAMLAGAVMEAFVLIEVLLSFGVALGPSTLAVTPAVTTAAPAVAAAVAATR